MKNGEYQILGLMHVTLRENGNEFVICRQNSAKVQVDNFEVAELLLQVILQLRLIGLKLVIDIHR